MSRFDLNITAGILHTAKEYEATGIIIGLHYKASIVDSFFGNLTENLLKNTYLQVMVVRFQMPVNTLRRIIVAVPSKAEFEHGFIKWVTYKSLSFADPRGFAETQYYDKVGNWIYKWFKKHS